MAGHQSIFVSLIIALSFRFGKAGIIATGKPWSTNESAARNLSARGPDLSGSTTESSSVCPPDATRSKNDSSTGGKICLLLCCPLPEARHDDNRLRSNATPGRVRIGIGDKYAEREVSLKNFHLVTHDPCNFGWMVPSELKNFYLLRDTGSIRADDPDKKSLSWDNDHYCLFRNSESHDYVARVCHPFIRKEWWHIILAFIFLLVMFAILIAYAVVPELKNLHGMIFRSYITTYIVTTVCVLAVEFTTEITVAARWYTFFETAGRCCCGSCLLWLNVMSFNIWRTFRDIRSINCNSKKCEKEKYTWYAVYAWGIPLVVMAPVIIGTLYIPYYCNDTNEIRHSLKIWTAVAVIAVLYSSNVLFFILTARAIRQHKKDRANLSNSLKKHRDTAEKWFNLHLKLFLIMGGHVIGWAIWLFWPTLATAHLLAVLELIQATLIFFVFVWRTSVKQSFCEQFRLLTTSRNTSPL